MSSVAAFKRFLLLVCAASWLAFAVAPLTVAPGAARGENEYDIGDPFGGFQPVGPKKEPPPPVVAPPGQEIDPSKPMGEDESGKGEAEAKKGEGETGGSDPADPSKPLDPDKPVKPRPATRPAGAKEPPLSAEARKLLADYARPLKPEEKETLVSQILATGPAGARALEARVRAELGTRMAPYQQAFNQEAQKLAKARLAELDKNQARQWQDQVNRPRKENKVTKEVLHAEAGPAIDNLRKALMIAPGEVILVPDVAKKRSEIQALHATLARCVEALPPDAVASAGEGDPAANGEAPAKPGADTAQELERVETILALMATPMKPADRRTMESNLAGRKVLTHEEFMGLLYLNVIRVLVDQPAMKIDPKLCRACRGHSKDMVDKKFFSHESPVPGKKSPWDRARLAGTSAGGECIAAGSSSGEGAIRMWFFSPGHHMIIMSGASRVGLGGVGATWTLLTG